MKPTKPCRVTVDFEANSAKALDEVIRTTGASSASIFRASLALFSAYLIAEKDGKRFEIVDPNDGSRTALKIVY